jgi:hypothetical protein
LSILSFHFFFQWFEDQLTQLNTTVHDNLEKRKVHTDIRLDELNTRITNLEAHFEDEKRTILKYVDDRGAELTALLNKFKVSPALLHLHSQFPTTYHLSTHIGTFKQLALAFIPISSLLHFFSGRVRPGPGRPPGEGGDNCQAAHGPRARGGGELRAPDREWCVWV